LLAPVLPQISAVGSSSPDAFAAQSFTFADRTIPSYCHKLAFRS
jgi:hypothetical protein